MPEENGDTQSDKVTDKGNATTEGPECKNDTDQGGNLELEIIAKQAGPQVNTPEVDIVKNPMYVNRELNKELSPEFPECCKDSGDFTGGSQWYKVELDETSSEHRHVGSTNFNLLSSRNHTIFTLTIESSPCGEYSEGGAVTLSQLHLIDLAGSESSKAETTSVRRKEGSYINKSLLTLGTVISKLTDVKATHIPYRDSKLTRLLQSSLSGQGRFVHRAKHIEIQAALNKIIDEKSLIKKYQNEIRRLKEELEQLKRGILTVPQMKDSGKDLVLLKQKLEDDQVRLQSRLEQEEEAKAALLGRIQRLTKLILVSTKTSQSSRFPHRAGPRRRHSFGEEERRDSGSGTLASTSDRSSGLKSTSTPSTPQAENHMESRNSHSIPTESTPSADHLSDVRLDKEVPEDNLLDQETPLVWKLILLRSLKKK
ncbi:hypothetical protein K7X08_037234 [Anisodus acutangulus]|uniref:Kinesin-like protein n=1 Tax=Anisodus acutangulus TaxID=402998 RepID=A0A9Q1L4T4_9SOLA|nr:hypothetical protein K7X08_037234 [Anisodus acutangulus]